MANKHLVVVSRKWHEPQIVVSVTNAELKIVMTMPDFVKALSAEAGRDLASAAERVIAAMKQETKRVM